MKQKVCTNNIDEDHPKGTGVNVALVFEDQYSLLSKTKENVPQSYQTVENIPVDFKEFSRLVARCMQRRGGLPGRSYVYPPTRAVDAIDSSRVKDKMKEECSFHPTIDQVCNKWYLYFLSFILFILFFICFHMNLLHL